MSGQEPVFKNSVVKLSLEHLNFLDRCVGFELKLAELYHHFEAIFADDRSLSRLWKKTAREEENHAQQFNLAVRLQGVGMLRLTTDVSKAAANLQGLETFLGKILEATPSREDALDLAIRLEEQLVLLHMSSIVLFEDQQLKKLFHAMMQHDQGHISTLRDYQAALKCGTDASPLC